MVHRERAIAAGIVGGVSGFLVSLQLGPLPLFGQFLLTLLLLAIALPVTYLYFEGRGLAGGPDWQRHAVFVVFVYVFGALSSGATDPILGFFGLESRVAHVLYSGIAAALMVTGGVWLAYGETIENTDWRMHR